MIGEPWERYFDEYRPSFDCDSCEEYEKRFHLLGDYVEKLIKCLYVDPRFSEENIYDVMQDLAHVAQVELPKDLLDLSRKDVKLCKIEPFPYFQEAVDVTNSYLKSI